jgi:hypothetical protein
MPEGSQHDTQVPANTRTTSNGNGRLYSLRAIFLGTLVGTFLAGGFLVARNYKQFGQLDASRNAMMLGVVGFIGVAIAAQFMPDDYDYGLVIIMAGTQAVIAQSIAKRFQGELLKHHEAAGGQFHSLGRAVGISVLLWLLAVLVMVCIGFFISAVLGQ